MRASGVICEFNPFHSGHAYLLSRMRDEVGADGCVVCLMSGRFVQRGEAAIADPYLRARTALMGGADLVLELPFPWSAGSAEHFAMAGVSLLSRLGVDTLTFGSECGDASLLARAAEVVASPDFADVYAALCRTGMGTTAAYTEAIRRVGGDLPDGFPASNDLLGIAYLRALEKEARLQGHVPAVRVVTRHGSRYREDNLREGEHPSATALRMILREAACDTQTLSAILAGTMPAEAVVLLCEAAERGDLPADNERLLPFFHAFCRTRKPGDLEGFAECGGGLAAHFCRQARENATAQDFFDALRTRQYTDARLRRALLFSALRIAEEDLRATPSYTTLLAANERGCAYLKAWQKAGSQDLTVVTKPADAPTGCQREMSEAADALYTLGLPTPTDAGMLIRRSPFIQG